MHFKDNNQPHFHVNHKNYEANLNIEEELLNNWDKAKNLKTTKNIQPL